jgi:hypothetical protein
MDVVSISEDRTELQTTTRRTATFADMSDAMRRI